MRTGPCGAVAARYGVIMVMTVQQAMGFAPCLHFWAGQRRVQTKTSLLQSATAVVRTSPAGVDGDSFADRRAPPGICRSLLLPSGPLAGGPGHRRLYCAESLLAMAADAGRGGANADGNFGNEVFTCLSAHEMSDFASLQLRPELQSGIEKLGYESLTDIQAQALPLALAGCDIVGKAKTGSGKTAVFALALLQKLDTSLDHRDGRVQALVLSPTRELASQLVVSK
jgi:hypothetical protein